MEMIKNEMELNQACESYKALKAQIESLEAQVREFYKAITDYMDTQNDESVTTEDYKVIWKIINKKDVDRKKLEADGLLEKYLKYSDYPQLRINKLNK